MELRHLRYFVAVAETENVTRAAQKLHVSQPGLSRQIRDLEEELGFLLLERSARSVRLTEAGRAFLAEARTVLKRVEEAVEAARKVANGTGMELHVGYATSPTVRILPAALRAFQAEMPKARVKLHDLSTEEMLTQLREGKLELALMVKPGRAMLRELNFEELLRDNMCVAVARNHPLARRRAASLAEVAREPLIALSRKEYPDYHESLEAMFAGAKVKPSIAEEHDSVSSLIASVEAGSGVALVSESIKCIAGPRLKAVRLSPSVPPLIVGGAWGKKDRLGPVAEKFLWCARAAGKAVAEEIANSA
jgi:DNA-binding transcriptional LysR family regulator